MELLQYVLSSFWRFCGFVTILYITLHYLVNGIVEIVRSFTKK